MTIYLKFNTDQNISSYYFYFVLQNTEVEACLFLLMFVFLFVSSQVGDYPERDPFEDEEI